MRKRTVYLTVGPDEYYARVFTRKPKKVAGTDYFGDPETTFEADPRDKAAERGDELCLSGLAAAGIDVKEGQIIKLTIIPEVVK